MKIKVEPFLMKKGNRVAKAAIEFEETDGIMAHFQLVGFTICDDAEKGLFVLFPSTTNYNREDKNKIFFFLRPTPGKDELLADLETKILDVYESMMSFNTPKGK